MKSDELRIAISHRDGVYRDCLSQCLSQTEPISIVHSGSELAEFGQALVACKPDLAIVEFGLCCPKSCVGTSVVCALTHVTKILIIGVPDTEEDILHCIERNGAAGYLVMNASLGDLFAGIRSIMKGEALCSPRIASLAFDRMSKLAREVRASMPATKGTCLTQREVEIIKLIEEGFTNKEIAVRLHIEISTVKNHVHNILDKLQLHNRYSAVKHIRQQAILTSLF
jgi:DNA-binding NarL/FixJ family response regulator